MQHSHSINANAHLYISCSQCYVKARRIAKSDRQQGACGEGKGPEHHEVRADEVGEGMEATLKNVIYIVRDSRNLV